MALVGTISGSNGTSNTAITGTLVIANTAAGFPQIPSDSVLYVEGRAVSTSDIVSSGTFRSMNSIAAEGGEIFLNKAVTSTIDTGVTIDVNNDRFRIFETGGTNRGGYIDIGALAAGVSTNLVAAASPGGSDTHVQFNDAASFGGRSDFRFNKSTALASVANLVVTGSGTSLVASGSIEVKDAAGTSNVIITPQGDITGSNLRLTGDIAVVGGDLTTTAASFNLVTGASNIRMGSSAANLIMTGTIDISGSSGNTLVRATAGDISIASTTGKLNIGPAANYSILHNNVNAAITNATGHILTTNNALNQRIEFSTTGSTNAGMVRIRRVTGTTASPVLTDLFEVRNDGTILIGSASSGPAGLGSTTISNDLFLSTGIIAVNTDTTAIQLVSSGNVSVKLDANNNATGHTFAVQNHLNANQFVVNENGNVDVTGIFVVSGSTIGTSTTTTFSLLNATLTGTLNIGGATQTINFGSPTTTSSFGGEIASNGVLNLGLVSERFINSSSAGSSLNFDLGAQSVFYVNNPTANIDANFTNAPVANLRILTPTIILSQSATPRIVSAIRIDGASQAINWANGVTPTGNATKQDVFGFSLIRSGSAWKVLGQMSTYG